MKFLRKSLTAIAIVGTLFGAACAGEEAGTDSQNTVQISESVMDKTPASPGEFSITRDKSGEWFFEAIGERGQIMLQSEGYQKKSSALNGILSVEENGVSLDQYEISQDVDGNYGFVIRAGNNQVIADSPAYRSEAEAAAAVEASRELIAGILQYKAAVEDGARFDLWRADDSEWYFVLRAEDGRILIESEGYTGRSGAVNGLESVRFNGKDPGRYKLVEANGEVHFILKAANGHEIGMSGNYESVDAAEAGIAETQTLLESERVGNPW